jgi:hypothetical protein
LRANRGARSAVAGRSEGGFDVFEGLGRPVSDWLTDVI